MITIESFLSFLHCHRKSYLKTHGCSSESTDLERIQLSLHDHYRRQALEDFIGSTSPCKVIRDPPSFEAVLSDRPRFIVNVTVAGEKITSQIHLLEQVEGTGRRGCPVYMPVLFVRNNKVSRLDKLLLAFNVIALTSVQKHQPLTATIVHGDCQKVLRVKIGPLVAEVRRIIADADTVLAKGAAPQVTLNPHCTTCEFRDACRRVAEDTDDLSLLRGLSGKEICKLRGRGITTVTQFSHTYQPGRRGKRRVGKARKHNLALQARALREKKVYVMDGPRVPGTEVALYLDVEGIPDRDLVYLIGLIAVRDGASTAYSFWADDPGQEKAIWDACARVIEDFPDYTLYHYGSYEQRFFDRMAKAGSESAAAVDRIQARSCNVLGAIYSHVYFPTLSNRLKDIAAFLGARWSSPAASGIQALAWRLAWEATKGEAVKENLLLYNREDCLALQRVTEFLRALSPEGTAGEGGGVEVASAQDIRPEAGFRFGKPKFMLPDMDRINRCAYSDYQRDRIYLRTSPTLRRPQRNGRISGTRPRANVRVDCPKPATCPACKSDQIHVFHNKANYKYAIDLKYTALGVKRCITRYHSARFRCWSCRATFLPEEYRNAERLGTNLVSWAVYHLIALRQSYEDVNLGLHDLFGLSFGYPILGRVMPMAAKQYQATYERLKDKLRQGPLVHADETKVLVYRHSGYVWAFANMEEVVYAYSPTREGTILEEQLRGFGGVLVSDFYTAYDSLKCPQQKCLIHLIRDINDDVFHSPFDEDLKQIAQRLVAVLKPIIETIDRYGLKQYHLNKHREDAKRYFRYLSGQTFGSEVARKYQKRMLKYREKLFVFLDHDGIPWNNNNAENALKHFVCRRRILGPSFSAKGMQNYLLFFSIYQTCRNKGLSFLRFLRSGMLDIDAFAESCDRKR